MAQRIFLRGYPQQTRRFSVEKLFALSIDHFEIRHGKIQWEDQTIPLDFSARDTSLQMDYYFLQRRYEGRLLLDGSSCSAIDFLRSLA